MVKGMKKGLMSLLLAVACLAGCGNGSNGEYGRYDKVHISVREYSGCVSISGYVQMSSGVLMVGTDDGKMLLSQGTYILVSGKCPICG